MKELFVCRRLQCQIPHVDRVRFGDPQREPESTLGWCNIQGWNWSFRRSLEQMRCDSVISLVRIRKEGWSAECKGMYCRDFRWIGSKEWRTQSMGKWVHLNEPHPDHQPRIHPESKHSHGPRQDTASARKSSSRKTSFRRCKHSRTFNNLCQHKSD